MAGRALQVGNLRPAVTGFLHTAVIRPDDDEVAEPALLQLRQRCPEILTGLTQNGFGSTDPHGEHMCIRGLGEAQHYRPVEASQKRPAATHALAGKSCSQTLATGRLDIGTPGIRPECRQFTPRARSGGILEHLFPRRARSVLTLHGVRHRVQRPQHSSADRQHQPNRTRRQYTDPTPPRRIVVSDHDLGRGLPHHGRRNSLGLAGITSHQRSIGNDVDQPRHTTGNMMQGAQRSTTEWTARRAGNLDPVAHVFGGLGKRKRGQVVARGDPLRQLAQRWSRQQFAQFGLAQQDDLQQLVGSGFEIGQQAHLLQRLATHVLGFIDDQHRPIAAGVYRQQALVEPLAQCFESVLARLDLDPELATDGTQQFARFEHRIQDQRDAGVFRNLFEQQAAQRGLAGADLASQLDKATAAAPSNSIKQVGQCVLMALAQEHEAWIGRDRKRPFLETVELFVHSDAWRFWRL